MNANEARNVLDHLSDWHLKILDDFLVYELHTTLIRKVYRVYQKEVLASISDGSLASISRGIGKSKTQTRNLLVNSMFLLTFYHNWAHFVLTEIPPQFSLLAEQLINQLDIGIQETVLSPYLLKIQGKIRRFAPQYACLIGNVHVTI